MRVRSPSLSALPSLVLLLVMLLAAGPGHGQTPPPPAATADVAAGPAAPPWLTVPEPLPEGWRVREASGESVTFVGPDAELAVVRQGGSANEVLGAFVSRVGAELGGSPSAYFVSVGGPWVQGWLVESAKGGSPERAVVAARRVEGEKVLTAVARGPQAGRGVGDALDLLARVRVAGDGTPAPLPPLALEGRPEARINPIGLFVVLPEGWKPALGTGEFWLRGRSGRLRFTKAGAAEIRELSSQKAVAAAWPGHVVQPLFWRAPGSYAAWQVLEVKEGEVVAVRAIHLVRYRKLDDWTWHVVAVEGVDPLVGPAEVHSVLARLKKIP